MWFRGGSLDNLVLCLNILKTTLAGMALASLVVEYIVLKYFSFSGAPDSPRNQTIVCTCLRI